MQQSKPIIHAHALLLYFCELPMKYGENVFKGRLWKYLLAKKIFCRTFCSKFRLVERTLVLLLKWKEKFTDQLLCLDRC